jgi:hypothetical protein
MLRWPTFLLIEQNILINIGSTAGKKMAKQLAGQKGVKISGILFIAVKLSQKSGSQNNNHGHYKELWRAEK